MKIEEERPPTATQGRPSALEFSPLLFAVLLFLMVYGVEIFNFGLSIDEEAATYISHSELKWIQQGRWGMALITWSLPNFGTIPLLSTLVFGAGLLFATWRAFHDFSLSRHQRYLFAALHVGIPVWLHIVQFSTLAAGVGFGLAAASVGSAGLTSGRKKEVLAGILLVAFGTSVYQTLALYSLLYCGLCLHSAWNRDDANRLTEVPWKGAGLSRILAAAAAWIAAVVIYAILQKLTLAISGMEMVYVSEFLHVDLIWTQPAAVAAATGLYLSSLFFGTNPTYLGWGAGLLFIMWLGVFPAFLLNPSNLRNPHARRLWLMTLAVAATGVVIVAIPIAMSNAGLPMRSQVAFPLLAAWIASRGGSFFERRRPALLVCALAYVSIVATSIGSSLFYVDQVVHRADAELTQQLVPAIRKAAGNSLSTGETPISLVGMHGFKLDGNLKRAELFGYSFYEHDRGNIHRVILFMRLQGVENIKGVWLSDRPELLPAAYSMPSWPADGSVQLVHGVVLIKLGPPTPPQLGE